MNKYLSGRNVKADVRANWLAVRLSSNVGGILPFSAA